jgi:hypothetical protein
VQHADQAEHRIGAGEQTLERGRVMYVGVHDLDRGQEQDVAGAAAVTGGDDDVHPGFAQAVSDGTTYETGAANENDAFELHDQDSLLLIDRDVSCVLSDFIRRAGAG